MQNKQEKTSHVEHLIVNGQLAKTLQAIGIDTTRSKFQLHQLVGDLAASRHTLS